MKRASIYAGFVLTLASVCATSAAAQTKGSVERVRMSQGSAAGEAYGNVEIVPSTMRPGNTSIESGSDRFSARGYDLKALISEIYDVDERRVDLGDDASAGSDSASKPRWDVTLQLSGDADDSTITRLLKSALERKFGLKITPETRQMDVYVLTAPNGPGAALHPHGAHRSSQLVADGGDDADDEAGQITYFGRHCSGMTSSSGIEVSAAPIEEFGRTLEQDLERVLVDETHLAGSYDFKIGNYTNEQELFKLLQQELGLVVTPAQRPVEVLTVRPAQEMEAGL